MWNRAQDRSVTVSLSLGLKVPLKPHHLFSWSPGEAPMGRVYPMRTEPPTCGQLQPHTPYSEQILRAPQPGHARMRWRQDRKPGQKARRHWERREPSLRSLQSPVQNFCSINNIAMTGLAGRPHSFYREIFSCKNVKTAMRHASGLSANAL